MGVEAHMQVRVVRADMLSANVRRLTLQRPDGAALPPCSAGSHTVLTMTTPQRTARNAYSLLAASLAGGEWQIAVQKSQCSRGGSAYIHEGLRIGDVLTASPPANLFALNHTARRHVLVAGGIGCTPVHAMAHELALRGAEFEIHYAARNAEAPLAAELRASWGTRVRLYVTSDGERPDFAALCSERPLGTHLYVCGPQSMIDDVRHAAHMGGWPASAVHAECFQAPAGGVPFTARLARSGVTVAVGEQQSLLEAIEDAGIAAPCLCRGGACGQCEIAVLAYDGELLHCDHFLSDADRARGDSIMLCMSRLRGGELVLDL